MSELGSGGPVCHDPGDDAPPGAPVPLVIMTHTALTGDFRAAVEDINRLSCLAAPSVYYPVAD